LTCYTWIKHELHYINIKLATLHRPIYKMITFLLCHCTSYFIYNLVFSTEIQWGNGIYLWYRNASSQMCDFDHYISCGGITNFFQSVSLWDSTMSQKYPSGIHIFQMWSLQFCTLISTHCRHWQSESWNHTLGSISGSAWPIHRTYRYTASSQAVTQSSFICLV